MNKLDYLNEKIYIVNETLKGSYLNKINEVSSLDYVFSFSKNSKNKLLISLTSVSPFFSLINKNINVSLSSLFFQSLKNKLLNSKFLGASLYNQDSIVDFHFLKTTDTYDKIDYHLLFEVFKGNTNLILLNNKTIDLSFRYHSLETTHPLIINTLYIPPKKIEITREIDKENELNKENKYIDELEKKYLKEKFNSLILQLKRKRKSLNNKKKNLEEEIEKAKENLNYKDYADYYLTIMSDIKKGDTFFLYEDKKIPLKENYSISDNLTYLYKVYKKAKSSINISTKFLEETNEEIAYLDNILTINDIYNEDDYYELIDELNNKNIIKIKNKNLKAKKIKSFMPYYFEVDSFKIGFGKNSSQNDYLTFKLAKNNDLYLHLANEHSSHVVIFTSQKEPNDEIIKIACSLLLYLSKKDDATIYLANKKDVKKGNALGQANLLKYETIYFKKDGNLDLNPYLNDIKRFI